MSDSDFSDDNTESDDECVLSYDFPIDDNKSDIKKKRSPTYKKIIYEKFLDWCDEHEEYLDTLFNIFLFHITKHYSSLILEKQEYKGETREIFYRTMYNCHCGLKN